MKINATESIRSFAEVYSEITTRIYGTSLLNNPDQLNYLQDYVFKGWTSAKGCIAAIINPQLVFNTYRTGLIGFFEFEDDPSISQELINCAASFLSENNCNYCIGPLNGDTWHKYRVTLTGCAEKIFMDNVNPGYYAAHFRSNNFECIAGYISLRIRPAHFEFGRLERFRPKIAEQDIKIRGFNTADFEGDLQKIYQVCIDSFKNNFLYSPVSFENFKMLYAGSEKLIHPEFVLLAECRDKTMGFIFAVPNIMNRKKKGLVIKTLAISSDLAARGLGSYMTELLHYTAHQQGLDEIYHLLMHRSNISTRIASKISERCCEYELYGKAL
jgi:L-amino acid N-acyltransferase YncA